MLTTSFQDKQFFFSREAVQDAVRAAGQDPQRLSQAGMVIRGRARNTMYKVRKKTTIAPPGSPPRSRADEPNLRTILYAWDASARQMVVGPVLLSGARVRISTVPAVHEHGGQIRLPRLKISRPPRAQSGRPATRKQLRALRKLQQQHTFLSAATRRQRQIVWYTARYPARPFMQPALEHSLHRLPQIWQGSIASQARTSGAGMVRGRVA